MATYDRLQRLSLTMRATGTTPLCTYRAYEFPRTWAQALKQVFCRKNQDGEDTDEPYGLPLWAVSTAIAALLPQLLVSNSSGRADTVWLAWNTEEGTPEPDEEVLLELVRSGLIVAAQSRNDKARRRNRPEPVDMQQLASILKCFRTDHLRSEIRQLHITAGEPLCPEGYRLLPHVIANHLVSTGWKVLHAGKSWVWNEKAQEKEEEPGKDITVYGISRWRRCVSDEGVELLSWPPHRYVSSNGTVYPWSYTMRLTAQNHGHDSAPLIHVTLGTRRWARGNVWDGKRGITAYLFAASSWCDDTCPFGKARMKWRPGPKGKKEGKMVWDDVLAETLARVTSHNALPSAPALAADPRAFLEPDEGMPQAGVPFRDGLGEYANHSVGKGISARDRWQIFHQLQEAVKDFAEPEQPLERLYVPLRPRPSASDLLKIDQAALAQATAQRIAVDVAWDTTVIRDELVGALHEMLDLCPPTPTERESSPRLRETVLRGTDIEILLRSYPVGELASPLPVNSSISKRKDRLADASESRRTKVVQKLRAPELWNVPRFALVEMANVGTFASAEHDPKQTVKGAAGSVGVLVQNITPPKETGEGSGKESTTTRRERARKSAMDLLTRQSGMLSRPDHLGSKDNPLNEVTTVGLWVVRRTGDQRATLPLAVAQLPDEPFARLRMPHTNTWLPFREGLLTLTDYETERHFDHSYVQQFFGEVVQEVCDGSDVVLLTLAQNLRSCCPGLSNAHLMPNVLAFDPRTPIQPEARKGLRHVRLRTNLRDETSQHFAFKEGADAGDVGVGSSLWQDPLRPCHFFSTARKPATAGSGSPQGSRIEKHWASMGKDEQGRKKYGMRHDVLQDVWNPRLLEILVNCHDESDDPRSWAAIPHQQRYAAAHFADPLALPAVLHLAQGVGEQILPPYLLAPIDQTDG
ncbi:RNaseH domain-containing protein [Streptomyces sp. NPDC002476]|uniref:RNaseH domain-containing protein n=1 Tax=Streptomyces sp. NPDC002476 TaxID=3364648 RepID=UPI0036B36A1F